MSKINHWTLQKAIFENQSLKIHCPFFIFEKVSIIEFFMCSFFIFHLWSHFSFFIFDFSLFCSILWQPPIISASRNFLAQVRKFKIAGIQSEATTIAATIWPSSGACTVADISTFGLGRPAGPAKFEGWKFCHCPSTTAWPFCCSCGCGFWLYASDVEFACLCLEISTSGQHPSQLFFSAG